MDKDQAADIQKRTFAILDAIREIESIAFECPKDERSRFSNPIGEIVVAARFGILETVYARFPELRANDKQEDLMSAAF